MKEMTTDFKKGALVWCKMKGYPYWPGIITDPIPGMSAKSNGRCVYFFGSKNYAWIDLASLKDYHAHRLDLENAGKTSGFKAAVEDVKEFLLKSDASLENDADPFDEIIAAAAAASSTPQPAKKTKEAGDSAGKKKGKRKSAADNEDKTPESAPKKPRQSFVKSDMKKKTKEENSTPKVNFTPKRAYKAKKSPWSPSKADSSYLADYSDIYTVPTKKGVEPPFVINSISSELIGRKIVPSKLTFGFIGLGVIGSRILKNLVHSNHKVLIWNRTETKYPHFVNFGAFVAKSPYEVINDSDVTFLCLKDDNAVVDVVLATDFIYGLKMCDKSVVNMTRMSSKLSLNVWDLMEACKCRYIEGHLLGTVEEANEGMLTLLAGGSKSLYDDCQTCFRAFARRALYLGEDVGKAWKTAALVHSWRSTVSAGLAEGLAIAKKAGRPGRTCLGLMDLDGSHLSSRSVYGPMRRQYEDTREVTTDSTNLLSQLKISALGGQMMMNALSHTMKKK